jgi:hypothetical protein
MLGEQARLAVALLGVALAGWPVILMQFEKGGLLGPRHRLGAAQHHQVAPKIAAAVDVDGAGQGLVRLRGRAGGCLCGGPLLDLLLLAGLQAVQIIGGALRMRGRGEDQALVVAQGFQPMADIGGVILANFRRDPEIGAKESGTELGDQFLLRIAFIAKPHAPEIPCEALLMFRPVRDLMRQRGGVALGIAERLKRRHLHMVGAFGIAMRCKGVRAGGSAFAV